MWFFKLRYGIKKINLHFIFSCFQRDIILIFKNFILQSQMSKNDFMTFKYNKTRKIRLFLNKGKNEAAFRPSAVFSLTNNNNTTAILL